MQNSTPLVCVFAHPDDESFGPGGAIAQLAQQRDVHIICVTSGDAAGNNELGKIRETELLEAAKILGVKKVDFLGFHDGTLCNNNYHEVADKIREKLLQYKPDTVMTFDFKGVSGHLDHVAVAMITSFVVKKLAFVKSVLYFCETVESIKPIREDYFVYVPQGYMPEETDVTVDYTNQWDTVVKAIKAHKSQQADVDWILAKRQNQPKIIHFIKLDNPV